MDVLSMINDYWTENKQAIEDRIQGWVRNLGDSDRQKKILAAREQFHQWKPLRVYISTSQAKRKGAPTFSLRYCGQEVATLKKGTGHLLEAKCLNSWRGDFNSWRSRQPVGMPRAEPRVSRQRAGYGE